MSHLLLTLGHNSSAILVEHGEVLCGYETERLSKIKSDSSFPAAAIEEIEKFHTIPEDVDIYVSHWFMDPKLPTESNKWWSPEYIQRKFPKSTIYSLSTDFTHHDAHAYSAAAFSGELEGDTLVVVCDGFGNYGETLSLYTYNNFESPDPKIFHRSFGFDNSIGLMYQYATAYLGMKMNQDEYKLLGYEAKIGMLDIDEFEFDSYIKTKAQIMYTRMNSEVSGEYDPMVSIDALPKTKRTYHREFDEVCDRYDITGDWHKRVLIARYVQGITEEVLSKYVKRFECTNLFLVGGVFMNVKLNNLLSKLVKGQTAIMPLSGDQGAAIGVYQKINQDFIWPNNLFWGKRDLSGLTSDESFQVLRKRDAIKQIKALLRLDKIVNVVGPKMEFGARALGNTSTVALPREENVKYINKCNNRSTIMPMAGFTNEGYISQYHPDYMKIYKSLEYMICTRDLSPRLFSDAIKGASHYDPTNDINTGRTQLVREGNILYDLIDNDFGLLINTSFNPHGIPIVYNKEDIVFAHNFMKANDLEGRIYTIVVEGN